MFEIFPVNFRAFSPEIARENRAKVIPRIAVNNLCKSCPCQYPRIFSYVFVTRPVRQNLSKILYPSRFERFFQPSSGKIFNLFNSNILCI